MIVTADHGEEFFEHGRTTHKGQLYEELVHVPFLFKIPGQGPGSIRGLVRNFDLMPTLLELAEVDTEGMQLEASNLEPFFDPRSPNPRLSAYIGGFPHVRMLRSSRYKLLKFPDGRMEFYDLAQDPGETEPRRSQDQLPRGSSGRRAMLAMSNEIERLEQSFSSGYRPPEMSTGVVDEETESQLKALGYLN